MVARRVRGSSGPARLDAEGLRDDRLSRRSGRGGHDGGLRPGEVGLTFSQLSSTLYETKRKALS